MSEWSVSGTHKAQEIKAVNKGPSDKGSPDSYESRAGLGLAAGSFRTRADGHEKTNHSDEHEGHHLHLPVPIHTYFFISFFFFFFSHYMAYFFLSHPSVSIFFSPFYFLAIPAYHTGEPGDTDKMYVVLTIKLTLL